MEQTQVVLTGTTRGGEGPTVADRGRWPEGYEGYPPWFGPGYGNPQRKKKRGLFGRRWFEPYGPQGYYAPRGDRYYRQRGPRY